MLMAKLTMDTAKEIAHSRGGVCLSEQYINNNTPMLWKCIKNHEWSARLTSVKNHNTWCPKCAIGNRRTRTIKDMRKFAEKKGGLCLATEYVNRRDPLEWQCKEGHKWKASAKDIIKGTWCRKCSTPGRKCVIPSQKIIPVQGHIMPEQEFTPIRRHDTQHRKCSQRRFNIDIANNIAQERGGKCLSTEYVNTDTPML